MSAFNFSTQAIKAITDANTLLVKEAKHAGKVSRDVNKLAQAILAAVGKDNATLACDEQVLLYKRTMTANGWKTTKAICPEGNRYQQGMQYLCNVIAQLATDNPSAKYSNKKGIYIPEPKNAPQQSASGKDSQGTNSGDCQASQEAMTSSDNSITDNFIFSENTDKAQARAMLTSQLKDMVAIGLIDIATLQDVVKEVATAVGGKKASLDNELAKAFEAKGFKVA